MPAARKPEPPAVRIRRARLDSGLTLKELAARLGVHFTTVSSWERGRSMPGYETMPRLAAALEVEPAELFGALWGPSSRPGKPAGPGPLPEQVWREVRDEVDRLRFLAAIEKRRRERRLDPEAVAAATGIEPDRVDALLGGQVRPELFEAVALATAVDLRIGTAPAAIPGSASPVAWEKRLGRLPDGVRRRVGQLFSRLLDWIAPS